VHEEARDSQAVHYFYWRLDLYKLDDYEPVKVHEEGEELSVLTRLHWRGLVLWSSPELRRGRPLVDFAWGIHTPAVVSRDLGFHLIGDLDELPLADRFAIQFFLNAVLPLARPAPPREFSGYADLLVREPPPPKYRFEPKGARYVIVVGEFTDRVRERVEGILARKCSGGGTP